MPRRFSNLCLISLGLIIGVAACVAPTARRTLTIFAASSLTESFRELGQGFMQTHPYTQIQFNFAGSQTLRTQLTQGASADVLATANQKEIEAALHADLIAPNSAKIFATNQLVIIFPASNPRQINTLADLAQPNTKLVLAAEIVPAGQYAREALSKMEIKYGTNFKQRVLQNVVSNEENVRQVIAKVQLAEAEVGIVYRSDVVAVAPSTLRILEIPSEFNVTAQYPIAPLNQAPNAALAQEFMAYVLSPEGQKILQKWGFNAP